MTELGQSDPDYAKFYFQSQRTALIRVDKGYERLFGGDGHPRYKSRHRGIRSLDNPGPHIKKGNVYYSMKMKGMGLFRWRGDERMEGAKVKERAVISGW